MTLRPVVLFDGDDPDLSRVARAVRAALATKESEPAAPIEEAEPSGAFALPVSDEPSNDEDRAQALALDEADLAIVLDGASQLRARAAGVERVVALITRLDLDWKDVELDTDLVLVPHEAVVPLAVSQGAAKSRVRVIGPVAPSGWAAHEDRAALKSELGLRSDVPWVVVRAHALDLDDPAPTLVQLSLVSRDAVWLFDVGSDSDAARLLRRRTPGYGLDAVMFADGADAVQAYQAADVVLGRLDGPEVMRALAVGAALVTPRPRRSQLGLAHVVETSGLASIADAAATLSVTLDAALTAAAVERGRAQSLALDAAGGAARVATAVRDLDVDKRLSQAPSGLPKGLERLCDPKDAIEGFPAPEDAGDPRPKPEEEDLDKLVDDELAALREKLGL